MHPFPFFTVTLSRMRFAPRTRISKKKVEDEFIASAKSACVQLSLHCGCPRCHRLFADIAATCRHADLNFRTSWPPIRLVLCSRTVPLPIFL